MSLPLETSLVRLPELDPELAASQVSKEPSVRSCFSSQIGVCQVYVSKSDQERPACGGDSSPKKCRKVFFTTTDSIGYVTSIRRLLRTLSNLLALSHQPRETESRRAWRSCQADVQWPKLATSKRNCNNCRPQFSCKSN